MAEVTTAVKSEGIQEIVRQIVERFRPQKIILFGSYASGAPTGDSDVDLLVVMGGTNSRFTLPPRLQHPLTIPFPWTSSCSDRPSGRHP